MGIKYLLWWQRRCDGGMKFRDEEVAVDFKIKLKKWKGEHSNEMGDHLASMLTCASRVDILTGYFFFDGFQGLLNSLESNKTLQLRILVGMDAGIDTKGLVYRVYEYEAGRAPSEGYAEHYLETLKSVLTHSDPKESVSAENAKLAKVFATMISEGRLHIRKTKTPNHSKLYIFHLNDGVSYSVGSSNFSYSGLKGRQELNAVIEGDKTNAELMAAEFDRFWKDALPITDFAEKDGTSEEKKPFAKKIAAALTSDSPATAISPFLAYMKVMREYLKLNRCDGHLEFRIRAALRDAHFDEYMYQIDAVSRAKRILDTNGGVIIADVVGLGKSVVGTLLAKLSDGPGVVLAPPHLVKGDSGWDGYLKKFGLDGKAGWKALSIYASALTDDPAVKNAATVIIDEAHNIRNAETGLYESVHAAIFGNRGVSYKRVVCLTATPFNNRPEDIKSLVSLFGGIKIAGEDKAAFLGHFDSLNKRYSQLVDDRRTRSEEFDENANKAGFEEVAAELKMRLAPLMIRRNRLDIKNAYKADIEDKIPEQRLVKKTFRLSTAEKGGDFYADVVGKYFGSQDGHTLPEFSAAMYHPEQFICGGGIASQQQGNLANMVRRFLVMRWESSPAAFKATLSNVRVRLAAALDKFRKEGVFIPSAGVDPVSRAIDDDGRGPVYVKSGVSTATFPGREIKSFTAAEAKEFEDALDADLKTLEKVASQFVAAGLNDPKNDGKLNSLIQTIDSIFHGTFEVEKWDSSNPRKVIVFSQYADTANYIKVALESKFGDKVMYAEGGVSQKDKDDLERHFRAKGEKAKAGEKTILVTTDVLSEGVNLNQAGVVVNYDISWNPVRTIQRIGRINRIDAKVHDPIYAVNFFPAAEDSGVNNVEGISVRKMKMIHGILGEDAKVLSDEEEPKAFMSSITDLEEAEGKTASDETRIAALYEEGLAAQCGSDPEQRKLFEAELDALGFHFSLTRQPGLQNEIMYVFSKNRSAMYARVTNNFNDYSLPLRLCSIYDAISALKCPKDTVGHPFEADDSNKVIGAYKYYSENGCGETSRSLSKVQKQLLESLRNDVSIGQEAKRNAGRLARADEDFARKAVELLEVPSKFEKLVNERLAANRQIQQEPSVDFIVAVQTGGML